MRVVTVSWVFTHVRPMQTSKIKISVRERKLHDGGGEEDEEVKRMQIERPTKNCNN